MIASTGPLDHTRAMRHDGWTPERRRTFLELLAEGHTVEAACTHVGMSRVTAYALRRRDPGFALAWSAAVLRARDAVADTLTSRAFDGQVDTLTRADGSIVTRHRYDNRLGLALLARLDRLAAQPVTSEIGQPHEAAARSAAHAFDALLALVEEGKLDADAVAAFVDPHIRKLRKLCRGEGVLDAEEDVDAADHFDDGEQADEDAEESAPLSATEDHRETRKLCKLCGEAPVLEDADDSTEGAQPRALCALCSAGTACDDPATAHEQPQTREFRKLRMAEPVDDPADDPAVAAETGRPRIWYRQGYSQYQTDLPPPSDFTGYQHGRVGDPAYWRGLTPGELARQKQRERTIPVGVR